MIGGKTGGAAMFYPQRLICLFAVLALIGLVIPVVGASAQNPCDGLVAPRLSVGGAARVIAPYGLSLKNRAATGAAGASEVALLAYGTVATVTDGFVCNYGYVWWQLRLPSGASGWAAEGADTDYFMEPYAVGLSAYRLSSDGAQLVHFFVTTDGAAQRRGAFDLPPISGTPQTMWQQVEIDALAQALDTVRVSCPARLTDTPFAGLTNEQALQLPLSGSEYDYYPSPDGSGIVLVRHLHLRVPRCDTVVPERVGISMVSVLDEAGTETVLFPYPQHGSVPNSVDRYDGTEPSEFNVYFDQVTWSPQGKYVAFVAAYRYACNRQDCYRFQMYISNLETGQLYVLGEGRHLGWTNGGEGINFFRVVAAEGGQRIPQLYTARPDGTQRQDIWLPGGAIYVSDTQQSLDLPWTESGSRVMVLNAGGAEVMLFNLADKTFTPPVTIPDRAPQENRLAVYPIRDETDFLWITIRGEFVIQNVQTGAWTDLQSDLASTGIAPIRARPFATGDQVLIEMADGTAYALDINADTLRPVGLGG
jgi:hypothetical protein